MLRHAHAATHGQTRLAFWGGGAVSRNTWTPMCQCRTLLQKISFMAAIAQLGERQTEDLKVPGSIPGLGMLHTARWEVNAGLRAALLRAPGQLLFVRPLVYDAATPLC